MNNDSALARGIRTFIQVVVGTVLAVWAVPGVPEVVASRVLPFAVGIGVPSALVAFAWNVLRKDVPNV